MLEAENKENKTPLVQAVEKNDIVIVNLLITLGTNVNNPLFYNQRTPLMISIYNGFLDIASLLIEKGANKYTKDINGLNILHYAVDSNILQSVKFCLEILEDTDLKDNKGWTPLLRAGRFYNNCNYSVNTFFSALVNASQDIIQLLLARGANRDIKDNLGFDFQRHLSLR